MSRTVSEVILQDFEHNEIYPRAYSDHTGEIIHNGLVQYAERARWNSYGEQIQGHIDDTAVHLSEDDRDKLDLLPYQKATQTRDGLMSKEDKQKLDEIVNLFYPLGTVYYNTDHDNAPNFSGTT